MKQPPRALTDTFLNLKELSISIVQGLFITLGTLFSYRYSVAEGYDENLTRTMVFVTLVMANVFLTLVNRSFQESIFTTFRYKNNLLVGVIGITILLLAALVYVPVFADFFKLTPLAFPQVGISALVGFGSVIWFEGYKWIRRQKP